MLSRPAGGDTPYYSWCVLAGLPGKRAGLMKAENKGELHFLWDPRLATLPWRTGHTEHGFRITCGLRAGKGGTGEIKTYYDI